jgi:hypothetical protein
MLPEKPKLPVRVLGIEANLRPHVINAGGRLVRTDRGDHDVTLILDGPICDVLRAFAVSPAYARVEMSFTDLDEETAIALADVAREKMGRK